jgi:probable HAF family extracellular repeat protein
MHGEAVGWANTTDPDPLCFVPNCIATHAFRSYGKHVTDLGTLPGGTVSQALWNTDSGLIAGWSENGETDPTAPGFAELRGVLWRKDKIIDLGVLPQGGYESLANAVNNRGQVVGFAFNLVPDSCSLIGFPTQTRAFLWQNGAMQDLGTLGGPDAIAELINDRGQISGTSYIESTDPATGCHKLHPFFWQNGLMLDIGTLGGTAGDVRAINERGEVVGFWNLPGDQTFHPFLWKQQKLIDLGTLGGETGETNWINGRGDIVGKADLPGPFPQNHDAVLWKKGKAIDLGVLPGDSCSNAYFINSRGLIVGTSENQYLCSILIGQHAFLKEPGKPMVDLNTLIPAGSSLDLTHAVAINDRGEIAGFGVPRGCAPEDFELCGHAYVLIPCGMEEGCRNSDHGDSTIASPILSRKQAESGSAAKSIPEQWRNRFRPTRSPLERPIVPPQVAPNQTKGGFE